MNARVTHLTEYPEEPYRLTVRVEHACPKTGTTATEYVTEDIYEKAKGMLLKYPLQSVTMAADCGCMLQLPPEDLSPVLERLLVVKRLDGTYA